MLIDPPDNVIHDLDNGLVARWATPADTKAIIKVSEHVFRYSPEGPPDYTIGPLIQTWMAGRHPVADPQNYAIIEDTKRENNRVVAATCLLYETWSYEGMPFRIGRPELVVSDPEYRNKGLIRTMIRMIHERCAAEGLMVQGITGITYFYRQFGYEYAVAINARLNIPLKMIPDLTEGQEETCTLREATEEDLLFIQALATRQNNDYAVAAMIPLRWWEYQLRARNHEDSGQYWKLWIIVDPLSQKLGFISGLNFHANAYRISEVAFEEGVNLQPLIPSLLRALKGQANQVPFFRDRPDAKEKKPPTSLNLDIGSKHPLHEVLRQGYPDLGVVAPRPYPWYVRVPNLPQFLRLIAPALEQRLLKSPVAGYTGELRLDFYRGNGLRLAFERGRITEIEDWRRPAAWGENEESGFPPLVFLQLLFGYRSLEDLEYAYPDVWVKDEVRLLVNTLFPKKPSWVLPLG